MSENEKLPDENINPSQAGQDMCPARCCCTLSYQIRIFILRDLIKLAFTRQNMCAAQTLKSRTHNSHFGLGSKSCIGRLLFRHRENFASRDSPLFQFGTSGSASFHQVSYQQNWELYLTHKSRQMEKIDIDLLTLPI